MVYAAHGLIGVLGVIAIPVTLRLLGASGYGLLSIYTLLSACVLIADLGVGKNLLRLLSQAPDDEQRLHHIRVGLGLYVLLCAGWFATLPVLVIVVPRFLFPVPVEYLAGLRWMVVLAALEFALGVPASLMQTARVAAQRFDSYAGYSLATGLTRNGMMISAALIFGSPVAVAAALALRKLVDVLLAGKILGWLPRAAWRPIFNLRSFKGMLSQSVALSAALVLNATLMGIGSPLVNAEFGLRELGLYRAAFDLAGKIAFVSNGVTLVVFPRAARYFAMARDLRQAGTVFGVAVRCSSIAYLTFAACGIVAAPWVLPAIGLRDATTTSMFLLLIVGLSLNAHSLLANELVQAAGSYRYSIYLNLSALVTLVVLFKAMPVPGVMAIGWAWIGAALVSAMMGDALVLSLCATGRSGQVGAALGKILATAACVGLLLFQAHLAVLCGTVLAGILGWAVRDAIRLRGATSVPQSIEDPVCA